jgi:alkylation response protein AidB-like acyl-CoA dehydrogenase
MPGLDNPLLDDREMDFQLYDVHAAVALTELPAFAEHSRETFDMVIGEARKFARTTLWSTYRELDAQPPVFEDGRVRVHPKMRSLFRKLVDLGMVTAPRGPEVGGHHLPLTVDAAAQMYLGAANLGAMSYYILCRGTGHLLEAFGSEALKRDFMEPLYRGEWTGTMALTEPHAGSSLADLTTTARPAGDGSFRVRGSKIFISGGDHDLTENIVHLVLARIEGAPAGTKGISLFAIPKRRRAVGAGGAGAELVPNDVAVAGMIHKIGWRALPSLIMSFGENDDCHGWLVGEPNQGLSYMFQMMNEARIAVGLAAAGTASVAYREALAYARTRTQGRAPGARGGPQVPIIEHADVRRMLLRQKALAEGSVSLVMATARWADVAAHGSTPEDRARAQLLLDLLTPIAKTFPAEKGFEACALAVQVHGGYGYSSEYLPEAWLRDQKLNTIHEGTTGIQSLDLLGRKAMGKGGAALQALVAEMEGAMAEASRAHARAEEHGLAELVATLRHGVERVGQATMRLGAMGMGGDAEGMMRHSVDYLEMASTLVVGWQWLRQATAASVKLAQGKGTGSASASAEVYEGKLHAARYFMRTELPRIDHLAALCESAEDSYASMKPEWF